MFFFQGVVIFIICVVSMLLIYMCFLLCLDPLITKRPRAQYQQQVNEEVNLVISGQRALSHLFHIAFLNQSLLQLFIISLFFNITFLYLHWVVPCTFYKVIFKYICICLIWSPEFMKCLLLLVFDLLCPLFLLAFLTKPGTYHHFGIREFKYFPIFKGRGYL